MAEANVPLVLVTGASGYVANHCVQQLLDSGEFRVRGTVRSLKNEDVCNALHGLVSEPKYPLELVEADLMNEECWSKAIEGCTYVLHVASPFFTYAPKHEDEFIKPAVEGTLNVLKACKQVGGVKRVVVTSSMAAIFIGNLDKELDEGMWSDAKKANPYEKSKLLAEKAAWDFVAELADGSKFELATINPGFIIGPLLIKKECASFQAIKGFLLREQSQVPDLQIAAIDVRDVAQAHIKAMTLPDAAGNRHILSASEHSYSFLDLATSLAKEFNSQGFNVPTKKAPKPILWLFSWFNKDVRSIYPYIGVPWKLNINRLKNVLGIEGRDIGTAVVEMGHSMLKLGMVANPSEKYAKKAVTPKKSAEKPQDDSIAGSSAEEQDKKEPEVENGKKVDEKEAVASELAVEIDENKKEETKAVGDKNESESATMEKVQDGKEDETTTQ